MRNFIADKFKERNYSMGNKTFSKKSKFSPINLGIGDLDITTDEIIIEKAMNDAKAGHTHYTESHGYLELREEICRYHRENFKNYDFSPENVMVVSGACHGLYLLLKSILNPEDEVILLAPFFPVYADQITLSNGKPVIVETKFENGFQIVKEDLEKAITEKTKAIIVNSPSKYIWAGMGDTLAKFYEVRIKHEYMISKNLPVNFPSAMGVKLSSLCRDLILENREKAFYEKNITEEFKKIVLAVLVNTGMVSNLVDEFLNGAVAHSVFYGLTVLPRIEKEHLHGEVVSFGILVQLVMEGKQEEYKELLSFYKKMKFPAKLSDVVVIEEFLEKEEEILKEILNGPDLQNFDFDMSRLKETLFSL